jgi:hypothetical protein
MKAIKTLTSAPESRRFCKPINLSRTLALASLAIAAIGALCQMIVTMLDLGRSAGWWP